MAEKIPTLPADSTPPTEVYRPLSRLALAGLVIAAGYAVVIGVLAVVAFITGRPLFLRIETLAIPALAAALAYVGRQQIRGSEGVLSGTALTTWALWLSGLSGLGFAAYYFGTYFAVTWQAGNFTRSWLDKIRSDKVMEAFLDTQKPEKRKNDKPNDRLYMYQAYGAVSGPGRKGPLPGFLESEAFKILRDATTSGEIKSLGVKDWDFSKEAYNVQELYQAKTLEGVYEVLITVRGSQGPEFEGRQWQVVWENVGYIGTPQLTETGKVLSQWRYQAGQFGAGWLHRRNQGDLVGAYLETLHLDKRQAALREMQNRRLLGEFRPGPLVDLGGPLNRLVQVGLMADAEVAGLLFLPGFRQFTQGKFVQAEQLVAPQADREEIVSAVRQNFLRPNVIKIQPPRAAQARSYVVNKDQGQFGFLLDTELTINAPATGNAPAAPKYRCDAYLVVESDTGTITPERRPAWRVAALQLLLGGVATPEQGPGPPSPPRPPAR